MAGPPERVETLVLAGGGMKGVSSLGAVCALRRAGALRHVRRVVGTSAGALVAAALVLDRASIKRLKELAERRYVPDIDLSRLLLSGSFGLDSGRHLDRWIEALLGPGAPYTFAQIRERHGRDLVVCATDLTNRRAEYFGPDTTPDMDVALALRMSCAIPLYFAAVTHEGRLYVDGAVADNFPLDWAAGAYGARGVLGICFGPRQGDPTRSLDEYLGALVECGVRRPLATPDPRVLRLHTPAQSAFNFSMCRADLRRLYAAGFRQARDWHKKHA